VKTELNEYEYETKFKKNKASLGNVINIYEIKERGFKSITRETKLHGLGVSNIKEINFNSKKRSSDKDLFVLCEFLRIAYRSEKISIILPHCSEITDNGLIEVNKSLRYLHLLKNFSISLSL